MLTYQQSSLRTWSTYQQTTSCKVGLSITSRQLTSSVSLRLFEGFEDVLFRTFPRANLKGSGYKTTATFKMDLFDRVIWCLGTLKRKTILVIAEARALDGV